VLLRLVQQGQRGQLLAVQLAAAWAVAMHLIPIPGQQQQQRWRQQVFQAVALPAGAGAVCPVLLLEVQHLPLPQLQTNATCC
jgi:hypothetical protein